MRRLLTWLVLMLPLLALPRPIQIAIAQAPPGASTTKQLSITWTPIPRPIGAAAAHPNPAANATAGGAMKHARFTCCLLSGESTLTGGDHGGNGPEGRPGLYAVGDGNGEPSVWSTKDGTSWRLLSAACPTAPAIYPARPDTVIWVIDSTRKRMIMMPGFYFGVAKAQQECQGPMPIASAMMFNPESLVWENAPWPPPPTGYGGDNNSSWGVYDPKSDSVYRYYWDGAWGANVQILNLATNTWANVPLGCSGGISRNCSGGIDSKLRNSFANRSQAAIDVQGRAIYWTTPSNALFRLRLDRSGHAGEWAPNAQAPSQCVVLDDTSQESYLVFDAEHRAVLQFCVPNAGGEIIGVAAYFVDAGTWTYYPAPTNLAHPVIGNAMVWSPTCRCVIVTGGHAIYTENPARPNHTPNPCNGCAIPAGNQRLPAPMVDWQVRLE